MERGPGRKWKLDAVIVSDVLKRFYFSWQQRLWNGKSPSPTNVSRAQFRLFLQGKGEFAMEYCKYMAASQQVQAELMERFDLERLKKTKSR